MAIKVYPSENDVGVVAGDGRKTTEANLSGWYLNARPTPSLFADGVTVGAGGVQSGYFFDGAAHSSGLNANIELGVASVRGFRVESTATIVVGLTPSTHNHLYLGLTKSGGLVTGAQITVQTSTSRDDKGTPPVDSIYLWDLETNGSTVVDYYDYRSFTGGSVAGTYVGNGASNRVIDLGFRPKLVVIASDAQGGQPDIYSISPIGYATSTTFMHNARGVAVVQDGNELTGFSRAVNTLSNSLWADLRENGFRVQPTTGTVEGQNVLKHTETILSNAGLTGTHTFSITGAALGDDVYAVLDGQGPTVRKQSANAIVSATDTVTASYVKDDTPAENLDWTVHVSQRRSMSVSLNTNTRRYFFTAFA